MVKFGIKLRNNKVEQWDKQYLDYDGLKKLMKKMKKRLAALAAQGPDAAEQYGSIDDDPRTPFAEACRAELRKVEAFYKEMCEEFAQRLEHLANFLERDGGGGSGEIHRTISGSLVDGAEEDAADSDEEEEVALFGDKTSRKQAGTISEVKLACRTLFREMNFLSNYAIVNYTGFVKIIKKYRKAVQTSGAEAATNGATTAPGDSVVLGESGVVRIEEELFHDSLIGPSLTVTLRRELSQSPIVRCEELHAALLPGLGEKYARAYCDGDVSLAKSELLMKVREASSRGLFHFGFRLGALVVLACWVVWDFATYSALLRHPALAAYRFVGYIVLLIFGWACCLYTWSEFRINWTYLFERNADVAYSYDRVFDIATTLALITLVDLLVFTKVGLGQLPAMVPLGWIPLPLIALVILLGLWHRPPMVVSGAGALLAPFLTVTFAGVFTGDVLTSMVRPLQDGATTVCYVATGAFNVGRGRRYFEGGAHGFETSLRETNARLARCASSWVFLQVVVPVLSCLPLWLRAMQSLRRYIDTRKRFPHLLNACKYGFAHSVVIFGMLHPQLSATIGHGTTVRLIWRILFVVSLALSSLSTWLWDVTRDWGLCRSRRCGCPDTAGEECRDWALRGRLMYRRRWYYRVAVCLDLVLRFVWTLTLIPSQISIIDFRKLWHKMTGASWPNPEHGEWNLHSVAPLLVAPFLGACELVRRWFWALIRVENEQLHNTSGFRRVKWVPMVFDTPLKTEPRRPLRTVLRLVLEVALVSFLFLAVVGVAIESALPQFNNGTATA